MKYYLEVLKKYVEFKGRAARPEYWYFVLFNIIAVLVLSVIDNMFNITFLTTIYSLGVLLPSLGVAVRRMHDIGKSGWWLLVALIPLVGWIWAIVLLATEGESAANTYGAPVAGGAAQPAAPTQQS